MDSKIAAGRLQQFIDQCAQLRQKSPHPSRPQIPAKVDPETWDCVSRLFQMSDIGSIPDEEDALASMRSRGLTDLCVFVRNAAAMDRSNQEAAYSAGVVGNIRAVISDLVSREITCPAAMDCVSMAAQALSNLVTGNKHIQKSLMESDLAGVRASTETACWCLLASVSSKTNMAGLVLILNSIKGDCSLTKLLCSTESGRLVANKIAEMFGENEDDESDLKNILYAILCQIIQCGCATVLLADEPSLNRYGLLDALAVYCNEGAAAAVDEWKHAVNKDLVALLTSLLARVHAVLNGLWETKAEVYSSENAEDMDMDMDDVLASHRCLASIVSILGSITMDSDQAITGWLVECQTLNQVVSLLGLLNRHLPRIERASEQEAKQKYGLKEDPTKHLFMFKCDLIRIIGNAAHQSPAVQDLMRDLDGLALVLDNMRIDDNHPYIKEHAVVALKSLLQDNLANQDYVRKMDARGAVQDPQLADAGLKASVGDDGKLHMSKYI